MFRIGDKVVFARDLVPHGNRTAYDGALEFRLTDRRLSNKNIELEDVDTFLGKTCEIVMIKSVAKDNDWFQYVLKYDDMAGSIEYFMADSDEIEFVTRFNKVICPEVSSKYRY